MSDFNKSDSSRFPSTFSSSSAAPVRPASNPPAALLSPRSSPNGWNKIEGTTSFEASPSPSYRYALSQENDKLHIWLEDCDSKKQWGTTKMVLKDYVDLSNAIPAFGVSDYAELFRSALDKPLAEGASAVPRVFQQVRGSTYRLEVSMELHVISKTMVASFAFDLEPISLEPIDHLESKVRDLQEQMDALRCGGQGAGPSAPNDTAEVLQTFAAHARSGDTIFWKSGAVNNLNLVEMVTKPGTYLITVVVNHEANTADHLIQLMKGTECIQFAYAGFTPGRFASSTLTCATRLETDDKLTVRCPLNIVEKSYATLVRLGN